MRRRTVGSSCPDWKLVRNCWCEQPLQSGWSPPARRPTPNATRRRSAQNFSRSVANARKVSVSPDERWFVYIARCHDGSLYTGIARNVLERIAAHNAGRGVRYTRSRRPVQLVHTERKKSQSTALKREAAIKAWPRARKLTLVDAELSS